MCLMGLAAVVGTCYRTAPQNTGVSPATTREYQLSDELFVIVVPEDQGDSEAEVRKIGRQKAAEMTVQQGYRYYTVEKEEKVQIIESPSSSNQSQHAPDLYEELIQRKNLGRSGIVTLPPEGSKSSSGYRMTIRVFKEKPIGRSVDACSLTDCGDHS